MYRRLVAPLAVVAAIGVLLLSVGVGLTQGSTTTVATAGAIESSVVTGGSLASTAVTPVSANPCTQLPVPLGDAAKFSVLAGTTVTNTGATVIHGALGLSPGSAITGFPPGKVIGAIDKADTAAADAQLSLTTAYNNAMARTNCPTAVAGNIGGKTLGPGLYKSTSSLAISSGDLTLDAHGHSGAVFVFQVTSKFTMTSGRTIILAGGALPENIFWAVGSSATLGSTAVFYGVILAHKSISLATGAVIHGKALAHIGAVTFQGNTVDRVNSVMLSPATASTVVLPTTIMARHFA
jgi:Ice-binding-like